MTRTSLCPSNGGPFAASWRFASTTSATSSCSGRRLRTIRANLPAASITLMATPGGSQVAPLLPWVDDLMVRRVLWQDISGTWPLDPGGELRLVEDIRERAFDAAIIFTSFTQSPYPPAYVCYLAGVPLRIAQSKEFGGGVLTQWVRPLPDDAHQVDRNLHLLQQRGLSACRRAPGAAHSGSSAGRGRRLAPFRRASGRARRARASPHLLRWRRAPAQLRGDTIRAGLPGSRGRLAGCEHPATGEPLTVVLLGSERESELICAHAR